LCVFYGGDPAGLTRPALSHPASFICNYPTSVQTALTALLKPQQQYFSFEYSQV
jgi:hypothetical protein